MIWAQTPNGVIGADGGLPWDVPEDMAFFRATTAGHPVIMGRRTWASFPARFRPLPERTNIVITRRPEDHADITEAGAVVVDSLDRALDAAAAAEGAEEIWIIGGGQIFTPAADLATVAAVTTIDVTADGDTYAPALNDGWKLASADPEQGWHQSRKGARYRIQTWARTDS